MRTALRRARGVMRLLLAPLLMPACADTADPLHGPLRLRALVPAGDTVRWAVEGVAQGARVVHPGAEIVIDALDSARVWPLERVQHVLGMYDGSTLIFDQGVGRVVLFDTSGHPVRIVDGYGDGPEGRGQGPGLFGMTMLPGDQVALWAGSHAALSVARSDGSFARVAPLPTLGRTTGGGLECDREGGLLLHTWLRVDPGEPEQSADRPTAQLIARTKQGVAFAGASIPYLPRAQSRLQTPSARVSGPGSPYEFVLLPTDGGRPVHIERAHRPVPVTSEEADMLRRRLERAMRRVQPSWTWNGPPIPAFKPAYHRIDVDREGRIWILISTPTLDAPLRELPIYDVYHSSGAPIARVELPIDARFAAATKDHLWTVRLDSLARVVVERARLELPEPLAFPR